MRISLFDNDGTLLKGGSGNKLHADAFSYGFETVYKVPGKHTDIHADGMLDNQILIDVAKIHGVPETEALKKLPDVVKAMVAYFQAHESECDSKPNDGAVDLLQTLRSHGVHSGVLTGNVEEIGWGKLQAAGLKDYIEFGSFGDMAMKRVDLIEIARQRYNKKFSENRPVTDFVIIGDTHRDISCAREGGIQVIAVAAGNYTLEQLEKEKPDLLLKSLEEKEKILDFLNN